MNYLDIYYRALVDYRKNTTEFRDCINQRDITYKANQNNDVLTVVRKICTVDTDWLEAIEAGMVHVEKAIREERQFIRSNGEVIDIEKVKNVSKDSVEHLARHSNLITRYEEGQDVVPDRLYTVERLSDYAVYENRFLYMLLCYLRDFITLRYNKILELEHTYNGTMEMNKTIVMTKRSLNFEIKLSEERKDDLYLRRQSESRDIIMRIGNQLKLVLAFLSTPLMQEVSKAPMLKPPITKTNVLRMNHDFRGALTLYEFISAYDKPGYTVEERVQTQNPFRLDVGDEMAEIVMLASFLTYEHGLNLKSELQMEYDKEEERKKEEEKKKLLDQLKALRHRIRESGGSPEEYMLALERVNRMLREDSEALVAAKQEINQLNDQIVNLENQKRALESEVVSLNNEIDRLIKEHEAKLIEVDQSHSAEIDEINKCNDEEKASIKASYEAQIGEREEAYAKEKTALEETISKNQEEHNTKVSEMEEERARVVESIRAMWQAEVYSLKENLESKDKDIESLKNENTHLEERRVVSDARLTAIRQEHGLISENEDFSSEESFQEIEKQLDTFIIFFKKQWGKTKKSIRRKAMQEFLDSIKAEKAEKKKNKKNKDTSQELKTEEKTEPKAEERTEETKKAKDKKAISPKAMIKMADMDKASKEKPAEAKKDEKPAEAKAEETKVEEAKAEEAKVEETKVEEAKAEETKVEEAKAEEAKAEEPKAEEAKAEETKAEEPKVEEAKVEEPKAEETPAGDNDQGDGKTEGENVSTDKTDDDTDKKEE